jgi:PKD repeat protein
MKKIYQTSMRHALAVLTVGLALGGMFAPTARADMYRWPASIPVEDESATGTRGIPGAAIVNTPVVTSSNVTVSWYGMEGWSTVEASTNLVNWFPTARVAATDYAWSSTLSNSFGPSAMFRVAQTNFYAGSGDCAGCHGNIYTNYAGTHHASALATLQAIGMGNNAGCVQCHSVGMNQPTGFTSSSTTPQLANVGCESCHGPAGWHRSSDHALIRPAITIDPKICGSCHQDSHHPTYNEYAESKHAQVNADIKYGNAAFTNYFTNTVIIGTKVYYGYAVTNLTVIAGATDVTNKIVYSGYTNVVITTAGSTNVIGVTNATSGILNSGFVPGSAVDPGQSRAAQCGVCHSAATRYAMLSEYNDALSGQPHHPINFAAPNDGAAWTAACATCHDPHSTNNIAQLRYTTWSTNFYTMPTTTDSYLGTLRSTNALGAFTTNTVYNNTTFDSIYNPKIQVCGQCHNSRGATWDGQAYALVTNAVVTTATNVVSVTPDPNTPWETVLATNVVTSTNNVAGIKLMSPLIPYVVGGVTNYSTNSSGYGRSPHFSPQYNILVGKPDTNFYLTATIHPHGAAGNTNQCATCHVPIYDVNATTKVTGHTYEVDFQNCVQCHSGLTDEAFFGKIEDLQYQESNSIARVVSLLNQWATTPGLAPDILRTNYGSMAWEYTTPGELGNPTGAAVAGPPSAFNSKLTSGVPTGTNDNMQLVIPDAIRKARFNIYMVAHDGSYGVHNPTFTKTMLTNAEALVVGQMTAAPTYKASFSVFPVTYAALITTYVGTNVTFTNLSATTGGTWNFGGPGTIVTQALNYVTYAYSAAGLYDVSYTDTATGSTMTRSSYIKVRDFPTVSFNADVTAGLAPLTVNFTNNSFNTGSVDWWRWTFSSDRLETTDTLPVSYTYTIPGVYSPSLRANMSGSGSISVSSNNYVTVGGLNFTNGVTLGVVPMAVSFTNKSAGMSNLLWNFGDGQTSTNTNPVNNYTNAGTYTVTLYGDYNGVTYSLARTSYVVAKAAPVASFIGEITGGKAPLTVVFDNNSSNATAYAWSFGDGNTSTNRYVANTYLSAGTNTVTLKAINLGVTNTLTRTNYIIVTP